MLLGRCAWGKAAHRNVCQGALSGRRLCSLQGQAGMPGGSYLIKPWVVLLDSSDSFCQIPISEKRVSQRVLLE